MDRAFSSHPSMSIDFLLNKHESSSRFTCRLCGAEHGDASALRRHQRKAHRTHRCPECNAAFSEKGNMNKHIKAAHQKVRNHRCTEPNCNAAFVFQDGLTRHIAMVHRNVRPFGCPSCDKTFKQRAHAQKHYLSVHQKVRPCVCHCGAGFRENYNLRMHQRTVHKSSH